MTVSILFGGSFSFPSLSFTADRGQTVVLDADLSVSVEGVPVGSICATDLAAMRFELVDRGTWVA